MSKAIGFKIVLPVLLVAVTLVAFVATASATVDCDSRTGKYTTIEQVAATRDADGFFIEGDLGRMRFSPRRRVAGVVSVSVQGPDGSILAQSTITTRPGFVPKGLRTVRFSGRIDGTFPADARLILRPLS
jgi:hypothetical protein